MPRKKQNGEAQRRPDPLNRLLTGAVLVYLAILAVLHLSFRLGETTALPSFVLGVGVLLLLDALVRVVKPQYRKPLRGRVLFGLIFVAAGIARLLGVAEMWMVVLAGGILAVIGVAILG